MKYIYTATFELNKNALTNSRESGRMEEIWKLRIT